MPSHLTSHQVTLLTCPFVMISLVCYVKHRCPISGHGRSCQLPPQMSCAGSFPDSSHHFYCHVVSCSPSTVLCSFSAFTVLHVSDICSVFFRNGIPLHMMKVAFLLPILLLLSSMNPHTFPLFQSCQSTKALYNILLTCYVSHGECCLLSSNLQVKDHTLLVSVTAYSTYFGVILHIWRSFPQSTT